MPKPDLIQQLTGQGIAIEVAKDNDLWTDLTVRSTLIARFNSIVTV